MQVRGRKGATGRAEGRKSTADRVHGWEGMAGSWVEGRGGPGLPGGRTRWARAHERSWVEGQEYHLLLQCPRQQEVHPLDVRHPHRLEPADLPPQVHELEVVPEPEEPDSSPPQIRGVSPAAGSSSLVLPVWDTHDRRVDDTTHRNPFNEFARLGTGGPDIRLPLSWREGPHYPWSCCDTSTVNCSL